MNRLLNVVGVLSVFGLVGCASVAGDYLDDTALTTPEVTEVEPSLKSMDIPKKFFDEILPERFHYNGIGIINNQLQFQQLWNAYTDDRTALPPIFDFEKEVLLFVYDPNYYNYMCIRGVFIHQGVVNVAIEKTDWTLSFGGSPEARRYREAIGEPNPEPKVQVSFLRMPRQLKGQRGITAVIVEYNEMEEMQSRVIPIPDAP